MENKVARTYLRRADFEQRSLSEGCRGVSKLTAKHVGGELEACGKADSSGSARLAAAPERINRALADALERHATKDP